ncbi:hypothetical protein [Streptomyces sp. NPDC047990]|uniref:hypothetical protein n=1 Tax=Streptomyces sp. NPDC047990 TaxID=3365496 RepID=UPI00371C750D
MTIMESGPDAPGTSEPEEGLNHDALSKGPFLRMVQDFSKMGVLISEERFGWHICRHVIITDVALPSTLEVLREAQVQEFQSGLWIQTDAQTYDRGHQGVPGSNKFTRARFCKGIV